MYKALAFAVACTLSGSVLAACPATTPVDTARWIFTQHADFYVNGKGNAQFLSKNLLDLLKRDWACQGPGDQCAIGANPWTEAQDGDIQAPEWKLVSSTDKGADKQAVVEMNYVLGYNDAPKQPGTAQSTRLLLTKSAASQCWVLDNLQGPADMTLVETLQAFPYEGD